MIGELVDFRSDSVHTRHVKINFGSVSKFLISVRVGVCALAVQTHRLQPGARVRSNKGEALSKREAFMQEKRQVHLCSSVRVCPPRGEQCT